MPSRERHQPTLFIIGGAEARTGRGSLLRRFVKLAGGKRARIAVIPTASSFQDEVVTAYTAAFTAFGAAEVTSVNPTSRHAAHDPQMVATLDAATGIFIGGTSAGASIMSEFMISLGEEGTTPKQRTSQLSAGLGLITGCVIDQHFDQRSRYGRLMSVIAPSPQLVGIGIDEDTAIIVTDGREFTVRGKGAVFVVDARFAHTDAPDARRGAPLLVSGAVVHTLPAGATFDLTTMSLTGFVEMHPDLVVTRALAKA